LNYGEIFYHLTNIFYLKNPVS